MNNNQKEQIIKTHCTFKQFCKLVYEKVAKGTKYRTWYNVNHKELKREYEKYVNSQVQLVEDELQKHGRIARFKLYGKVVVALGTLVSIIAYIYFTL